MPEINITPNKPHAGFEGHIGAEIGTEGHYLGEAVINDDLSDNLAGRVALRYTHNDHAYHNSLTGKPVSEPNTLFGRASLRWQGERDDVLFSAEHDRQRDFAAVFSLLAGNAVTELHPGDVDSSATHSNASLNWRHDWPQFHLQTTTGWADFSNQVIAPNFSKTLSEHIYGKDYRSKNVLDSDMTQWFQEFHLGSNEDAPFFWLLGANYYHSKRLSHYQGLYDDNPLGSYNPFFAKLNRHYTTDSFAVFGEATYPLTDHLDLTTGLRYTWNILDYQADWTPNAGYAVPGASAQYDAQKLSDNFFTGRVALNYALTDDVHTHITYARGYKPGGFSDWDTGIVSGKPAAAYKPATVDSFEWGVKSNFSDQRIQASAALFYNRTQNDHVFVTPDPTVSYANITENYDTKSKGMELALSWQPVDTLTLRSNLAYTDARISGKPQNSIKPAIDIGNRVPDVPKWSGGLAAEYRQPMALPLGMGNGNLVGFISYQYSDKRAATIENQLDLKAHHQVNARIGVENANLDLYVWGNNLLDERRETHGYYFPALPAQYGGTGRDAKMGAMDSGRSVGIGFRYHF